MVFRLELPDSKAKLSDSFHVRLLKPYHANLFEGIERVEQPPPPVVPKNVEEDKEYIVEVVLDLERFGRNERVE